MDIYKLIWICFKIIRHYGALKACFLKFLDIKHFMQIIIIVGMQYNYIF